MANTTKTNTKSKSKSKKNNKKNWSYFLFIILVILSIIWYVSGKPTIDISSSRITVVQTEEPLIKHIPEIIRGEYPPAVNETETKTETTETELPVQKTKTVKQSQNECSNPALDKGNAEDSPLYFGNPSDAEPDVNNPENYLMAKPQYTVSYNTKTLCPNWAAWHLSTDDFGKADRSDDFRPDPELPSNWYAVKKADYQYNLYGYDRGHVCPSADRTATKEDNSMTFLMTNMVPQSPDNNRVIWMHFENYERELANAGNEVYIIAGPYGSGGTGAKGTFDEIPVKLKSGETLHMNVPASTWKVLLAFPKGTDDINRISSDTISIAINVPNKMGMGKTGDWEQFICSIDDIEALTGYDFFELLPDEIEDKLEAAKYNYIKNK